MPNVGDEKSIGGVNHIWTNDNKWEPVGYKL